jgi:hypothetical protein
LTAFLIDDPTLIAQISQLDTVFVRQRVFSRQHDMGRRFRQLGHRQCGVSLWLRYERNIEVGTHQPVCQIGGRLAVDADFQARIQVQPYGIENLHQDRVNIWRFSDLQKVSGTILDFFRRTHRPLPVGESDTCVFHIGSARVGDFY